MAFAEIVFDAFAFGDVRLHFLMVPSAFPEPGVIITVTGLVEILGWCSFGRTAISVTARDAIQLIFVGALVSAAVGR